MLQKHFPTHVMPRHLVCVCSCFHFQMYKTWQKSDDVVSKEEHKSGREKQRERETKGNLSSLVVKSTKSEDDDGKGIS